MRTALIIVLATLILSSAHAERAYSTNPPKGKVYTYKEADGVTQEIEIYFPKASDSSKEAVPGIILFHGGGWGGGTRKMFSYQCNYFASRGLVAATVSYRLVTKKEKQSMQGEISYKRIGITSAKSAIRWFKQHADELGVDPKHIIIGGGSAGGHICLLATTNPGLNDPDDPEGYDTSVAAYVLFNPALNKEENDSEVCFQQHINSNLPPLIVFYGSEDNWMEKGWNSAYDKMKSLGVNSVDMLIAEGERHAFFNNQPWANLTLVETDKFLNKHGFIEGAPTLAEPQTEEMLIKSP